MAQGENNLDDILGLMDELEGKVNARGTADNFSINEYKKIVNKFDDLSINISNRKINFSRQPQSRLDELSDIMTSIANLDFSKRAHISNDNNHLDYLATGLNLISFHLEKAIKPLLACKDFFEDDGQGIYIIDETGQLIFCNTLAKKILGFKKGDTLPEDMSYLLEGLTSLDDNNKEIELTFKDNKNQNRTYCASAKRSVSRNNKTTYIIKASVGKNIKKCDKMFEVLTQIKSALEDKSKLELAEYFWLNEINQLLNN